MTRFSYPDILATKDRELYAYLVKVNMLIKELGSAINRIEDSLESLKKEKV